MVGNNILYILMVIFFFIFTIYVLIITCVIIHKKRNNSTISTTNISVIFILNLIFCVLSMVIIYFKSSESNVLFLVCLIGICVGSFIDLMELSKLEQFSLMNIQQNCTMLYIVITLIVLVIIVFGFMIFYNVYQAHKKMKMIGQKIDISDTLSESFSKTFRKNDKVIENFSNSEEASTIEQNSIYS